ncbi:hypothetical protein CYL21_0778 [Plasmodium falciparum NF54]|uniref:Uncharacterized protein n=3 Tax=Plasmodium falciparum TaxID=5833 RepID=Q8II51_PLAF7|nr:conserved Plasmodium protein, unknown function [Plasmodium falciparum 3D7]KAF4331265.1 hypothetical protein CYL21_0778 [Plasmodium falciparum NF54]PKC48999.1 hypothetical protein CK202_0952 [Plasmodium falciparum NF54]CZT98975.1 conserved Plasmodium protein, unknown function [Plasmodium falciparum 3D7]|eukprot:XP_001347994.1 conserved Plasmodium protein, unknown function [Plasmodium falciparum 3D7]
MRGLKKIGCFLFENSTLPTINTFIILDIILRILKIRGNKKKREKTKKNYKKKKLKRALLLTNKTLIDLFPPDFDFILNFLNNSLDRKDKDNDKDNDNNNDNHIDNNNDNNNENIWTVNKIKNYKNLYRNFKDDKKYNIKNNNQNEEKNSLYINNNHICDDIYNQHIYNLKNEKQTNDTFDNLHITIEMLKDILNFIHIKYIDKENYLINLLYKLNQNKKYNIIVINISFFFIKDDKKIKIFLDYILSSAYKNVTKELTMKNKDKNNYDHKNEFLSNSNNIIYSNIEAEMCDRPFYKNILNIYFHYSYFINFFEYLNSVSHLSLTSHNIKTIKKKKKKKKKTNNNNDNDNNNYDNNYNNNNNYDNNYNNISQSSNKCNIISYHHHNQKDDQINNFVEKKNKRSYFTYLLNQNHSANLHSTHTTHDKKKIKLEQEEKYEYNEYNENNNNMNDHNQNISSYNNIFQSNNIPNNNELSNLISPQQKEENILSNQLKSHKQIDVTEIHIEDESTKGCLSMHSIKLKKNKNKIRTKLYLFDMIPKSNIYKKMYMDIILMNFNHLYVISRNI